ncbi:hypothetical protein B5P46_12570 [Rhizobium leguminosarum]|uniref:Uncharacterized protein n=1 Tax=Rhizobium leguminosarum TaxID=384 RepID=A0A4Q1U4Z7_RHILE|nr:hypothetical protein B5P46_12570 [Rhizobium leguminosarum]
MLDECLATVVSHRFIADVRQPMSLLNLVTSKLNQLFIHLPPIAKLARRPTKFLRLSNNGAKFGHRAMPWRTEGEVVIRFARTWGHDMGPRHGV